LKPFFYLSFPLLLLGLEVETVPFFSFLLSSDALDQPAPKLVVSAIQVFFSSPERAHEDGALVNPPFFSFLLPRGALGGRNRGR